MAWRASGAAKVLSGAGAGAAVIAAAAIMPLACSSKAPAPTYLSRDALLDPATCASCHSVQFAEWSSSMHAYAADDPVFRAMNQRGQRETNGQLGPFCVKCHAPMAVREGATSDGLNLDSVPQRLHGVTCFFCHTVDEVQGSHDDPLVLANDVTMRGEYHDPLSNSAHPSAYSALHDRDQLASASLCGPCHDIVAPPGAAIERTFAEWQASIFSHPVGGDTCAQCHMEELPKGSALEPIAQAPNAPPRKRHAHSVPAVDQPLTSFPSPPYDAGVPSVQEFLDTTAQTALCVTQGAGNGAIRVIVDNVGAGHALPSGSTQDRRMWAEVIAYSGGNVVYQSGVVPPGGAVTSIPNDPDLWLLRDCMFGADGGQVNMFWQAASEESNLLPFPVTSSPTDPRYYQTHVVQYYPRDPTATLPAVPDKVTLRLMLQPIGQDVLADLQASGDLDAGIAAAMPTLVFPEPILTWTAATANGTYFENQLPVSCITDTALNVAADKFPAVNHAKCSP
jgi:hypothetical protein